MKIKKCRTSKKKSNATNGDNVQQYCCNEYVLAV